MTRFFAATQNGEVADGWNLFPRAADFRLHWWWPSHRIEIHLETKKVRNMALWPVMRTPSFINSDIQAWS